MLSAEFQEGLAGHPWLVLCTSAHTLILGAIEKMLLWSTYTGTCICPEVRLGHSGTTIDFQNHKMLQLKKHLHALKCVLGNSCCI